MNGLNAEESRYVMYIVRATRATANIQATINHSGNDMAAVIVFVVCRPVHEVDCNVNMLNMKPRRLLDRGVLIVNKNRIKMQNSVIY